MGNRDRVQVHDADIGVVGVLQVNPVANGPKPITEMQCSSRLNTGEDPWPRHESGLWVSCLLAGLL
jgi:hypothetical protein